MTGKVLLILLVTAAGLPPLVSPQVKAATPGALKWVLRNG